MDRLIKGIWIPIEIWEAKNISWNEKILLMEIDSFTSKGKDCYISNEYIQNLLGVSERAARSYLSNLIKYDYVKMVKFDGRKRYVESNCRAGWQNFAGQDGKKLPHTNIENTNISSINIEDKRERKGFTPPTIEEVREYCLSRQNGIDPEEFVAFYTSKGWMVGKNKMKDWKSAIITWEKSRKKSMSSPRPQPRQKESVLSHNLKVMDQMFGTDLHSQAYGKKEVYDEQ